MESTASWQSEEHVDIGELILSIPPNLEFEAAARKCSVRLVAAIGCAGDAHRLAVVEPIEIAEVAGVVLSLGE
jgi:hypothetical protein